MMLRDYHLLGIVWSALHYLLLLAVLVLLALAAKFYGSDTQATQQHWTRELYGRLHRLG